MAAHRNTLEYIALTAQLRELWHGVQQYALSTTLNRLPGLFSGAMSADSQRSRLERAGEISEDMALVMELVLHELDRPMHLHGTEPTTSGHDTAAWIGTEVLLPSQRTCSSRAAANGGDMDAQLRALLCDLACASLSQLYLARNMCLVALQLSIEPSNCLALTSLARTAAATSLAHAARECALSHFSEAMQYEQYGALSESDLGDLLQDDALTVPEGEAAVLTAILEWADMDPAAPAPAHAPSAHPQQVATLAPQAAAPGVALDAAQQVAPEAGEPVAGGAARRRVAPVPSPRQQIVARLVSSCVRGGLLTLEQLDALDRHPQVGKSEAAIKAVAGWYLGIIMGSLPQHATRPRTASLKAPRMTAGCASPMQRTDGVSGPALNAAAGMLAAAAVVAAVPLQLGAAEPVVWEEEDFQLLEQLVGSSTCSC